MTPQLHVVHTPNAPFPLVDAAPSRMPAADARQLARQVHESVKRYCPSWLRSRSEDIGQITLMRLLDRTRRSPTTVVSRAYVRRAAHNAVVDEIRAHARRDSLHAAHRVVSDEDGATRRLGPDASDQLLARTLDEHLARLGEDRGAAVRLYLEGLQIAEIADQLGWKRKKASNAVFRGLARLRQSLADDGITPALAC